MGYGVEFQGWFQSTISGNFVTSQLVEAVAQQQLQNPNVFILIHDMSSIGQEINLKALRLSTGYMNSYVDGKWKSRDLEKNKISYLNIFDELELDVQNQSLVNLYLASSRPSSISESDYNIVNLLSILIQLHTC